MRFGYLTSQARGWQSEFERLQTFTGMEQVESRRRPSHPRPCGFAAADGVPPPERSTRDMPILHALEGPPLL